MSHNTSMHEYYDDLPVTLSSPDVLAVCNLSEFVSYLKNTLYIFAVSSLVILKLLPDVRQQQLAPLQNFTNYPG